MHVTPFPSGRRSFGWGEGEFYNDRGWPQTVYDTVQQKQHGQARGTTRWSSSLMDGAYRSVLLLLGHVGWVKRSE